MTRIQQIMAGLLFAVSVGVVGILTGYHYGAMSVEVKQDKTVIKATDVVRKDEAKSAEIINNGSKGLENAKQTNKANAATVDAKFNGLRVASNCASSPTLTADSSERTDRTGSERSTAGSVDFTDVAKQITQLGHDYDDAIAQIKALHVTLAEDRRLCNVE